MYLPNPYQICYKFYSNANFRKIKRPPNSAVWIPKRYGKSMPENCSPTEKYA